MHLLLKKKWEIKSQEIGTQNKNLVEAVLENRGIRGKDKIDEFLNPPLSIINDPFLMADMKTAVQVITESIMQGEKIVIFGDYDVDGISSAACLYLYLKSLGADCSCIIPDRIKHGYGLSEKGKNEIIYTKANLVITVDCGISSIEEIKQLKEGGIKVVVTDHHECKETLPPADAVINPKRSDDSYPFKGLAGAGVSLKLVQAMCLGSKLSKDKNDWQKYLDIITLGTIGDVVPLIEENRSIVKHGLEMLNNNPKPGLKMLFDKLQLAQKDINTMTVSYNIVPYINASGRMGDGTRALDLLTGKKKETWDDLSDILISENDKRRETETVIVNQAKEMLLSNYDPMSYNVLVAYNKSWHQGVLGIVASRLTEYFQRSVIVFGWDKAFFKGSARSAANDCVLDAITYAKEYTIAYGGHKKAAGLSVAEDQMESFIAAIEKYSANKNVKELYDSNITIDTEIDFAKLNLANASILEKMQPYGTGNDIPTFLCKNLYICKVRSLSEGKHQKFILSDKNLSNLDYRDYNDKNSIEGVAFGFNHDDYNFVQGDLTDVVFSFNINNWNGKTSAQLIIKDIRKVSNNEDILSLEYEKLYEQDKDKTIEKIRLHPEKFSFLLPQSEDFSTTYRYISNKFGKMMVVCDMDLLAKFISDKDNGEFTTFKLCRIFDIFEESKLLSVKRIDDLRVVFEITDVTGKADLKDAKTYKEIFF